MTVSVDRTFILDRLKHIVIDRIDVSPELLQPSASLRELGIDSFSLIELIFLAEEEFKIRIPLDLNMPSTVDEVIDVIGTQLKARS